MYLATCTRPDIAFSVNLLVRYSSAPTRRHWKGIQHILRYLSGTTDMGLFYSNHSEILTIHEASRECIWLRSMIHHIQESCGLSFVKDKPTILFEVNAACIA